MTRASDKNADTTQKPKMSSKLKCTKTLLSFFFLVLWKVIQYLRNRLTVLSKYSHVLFFKRVFNL